MPGYGDVRRVLSSELDACLDLAESRDWGRERGKWELLFQVGEVFGIDAPDGRLAAVVVLTRYGDSLAVVGMLLVAPRHGRRGLGRRLMEHLIEVRGAATLFLYATEEGLPLYERLGFVQVDTLTKHVGTLRRLPAIAPGVEVREATVEDFGALAALDGEAVGAPRHELLRALLARSDRVGVATRAGQPLGYCIRWSNLDVSMLGPLVATDDGVATSLIAHAGEGAPLPVRLDFPSRFSLLMESARECGLQAQPPIPAMTLGGRGLPGARHRLYAVAAQAFG